MKGREVYEVVVIELNNNISDHLEIRSLGRFLRKFCLRSAEKATEYF